MNKSYEHKPNGYKVRARSTEEIRSYAHSIRKMLSLKKPYVNIIKVLEVLTEADFFELEILENHLFDKEEWGRTKLIHTGNGLKPLIQLKEEVFNGADIGDGFHRFTVAHEIGHAIMHVNELKLSRSTEHRNKFLWYLDSEWQANTFAAEFLSDNRLIKRGDSAQELADRFGISLKSSFFRLKKMKYI